MHCFRFRESDNDSFREFEKKKNLSPPAWTLDSKRTLVRIIHKRPVWSAQNRTRSHPIQASSSAIRNKMPVSHPFRAHQRLSLFLCWDNPKELVLSSCIMLSSPAEMPAKIGPLFLATLLSIQTDRSCSEVSQRITAQIQRNSTIQFDHPCISFPTSSFTRSFDFRPSSIARERLAGRTTGQLSRPRTGLPRTWTGSDDETSRRPRARRSTTYQHATVDDLQARSQGGFGGCGRTPLFLGPKKKADAFHRHSRWLYIQQQSSSSSSNRFIEHDVSTEEGPSFRVETSCSIKRLLEDEELCCWKSMVFAFGSCVFRVRLRQHAPP